MSNKLSWLVLILTIATAVHGQMITVQEGWNMVPPPTAEQPGNAVTIQETWWWNSTGGDYVAAGSTNLPASAGVWVDTSSSGMIQVQERSYGDVELSTEWNLLAVPDSINHSLLELAQDCGGISAWTWKPAEGTYRELSYDTPLRDVDATGYWLSVENDCTFTTDTTIDGTELRDRSSTEGIATIPKLDQLSEQPHVYLPNQTYDSTPDTVSVPVEVKRFDNLRAATITIRYDPSVLTFHDSSSNVDDEINIQSGESGTVTLFALNTSDALHGRTSIATLEFEPNAGTTNLTYGTTEAGSSSELLHEGSVSLGDDEKRPKLSVSRTSSTAFTEDGAEITVPVTLDYVDTVQSLEATLGYDDNVLSFDRVEDLSDVSVDETDGEVTLSWSGDTPVDNPFMNVVFSLDRAGISPITFGSTTVAGDGKEAQEALKSDGTVEVADRTEPPVVTVNDAEAQVGETFTVPVTVEHFNCISAWNLRLEYDEAALSYTEQWESTLPMDSGWALVNLAEPGDWRMGVIEAANDDQPFFLDDGAQVINISFAAEELGTHTIRHNTTATVGPSSLGGCSDEASSGATFEDGTVTVSE